MWVNRSAIYPWVTPESWRTRAWLLIRKVRRDGCATANDRRVAMLLLGREGFASRSNYADLKGRLEEISYGGTESRDTAHAHSPEGVGPTDRDHEPPGQR